MMKQAALVIFPLFLFFSAFAQKSFNSAVYFETAEAELLPGAKEALTDFAADLKEFGDYTLEIKAHTDHRGSNEYNLNLSNSRAKSVINFLGSLGIESSKLITESFGESRPTFSNENEQGMQKNRRVDLLGTVYSIENLSVLLERLSDNDLQEYNFPSDHNVKLTADNGTSVWIPADAFLTADGRKIKGNITFKMQETYSEIDMIANGLSTLSGGKMLETGGMIYMQAESEGEQVKLRSDVEMLVEMPTDFQKEDMELFSGVYSDGGGQLDWQPTGQRFQKNEKDYLNIPAMPKRMYPKNQSLRTYTCDNSSMPKKPKGPRTPIKPREPKREQFRYNPGFFKTVTMGKKKINSVEEVKFKKAMKDYNKRIKKYNKKLYPEYLKAKESYIVKVKNHKLLVEKWEEDCQAERNAYYEKKREEFAAFDSIYLEKYKEQIKIWKKVKQRKVEVFENKFVGVGKINTKTLNSYFYQVNQLGWINCDRFWDVADDEKMMVQIQSETGNSKDEMVYVTFKNSQSIIRANRGSEGFTTNNLPLGEEIKIIGIKVENGRPHLAVLDTKISKINQFSLTYEASNLKDIRKTLENLDAG